MKTGWLRVGCTVEVMVHPDVNRIWHHIRGVVRRIDHHTDAVTIYFANSPGNNGRPHMHDLSIGFVKTRCKLVAGVATNYGMEDDV